MGDAIPEDPSKRSSSPSKRLLDQLPALVFLAVPVLLILPPLGHGQFLYGDDVTQFFSYTCGEIGRSLAQGHPPVWHSHLMAGTPLLAGMQYGVLYPPSWIAGILRPGPFCTWAGVIHLTLSGFFAFDWPNQGLRLDRWAGLTQRAARSDEFLTTYSLPPEGLSTLLAPTFFGDSQEHPSWGRWLQWDLVGFIGIATGMPLLSLAGTALMRRMGRA